MLVGKIERKKHCLQLCDRRPTVTSMLTQAFLGLTLISDYSDGTLDL